MSFRFTIILAATFVLGSLSTASAQYYYGGAYGHGGAAPMRGWGGPPVLVSRRAYLPSYGYGYYGYRSTWTGRASQSRDGGW